MIKKVSMSIIDETMRKLADGTISSAGNNTPLTGAFYSGFKAAIDLQLPIHFGKYLSDNFRLLTALGWVKISDGEWLTEEEIYEDWVANIYTPPN